MSRLENFEPTHMQPAQTKPGEWKEHLGETGTVLHHIAGRALKTVAAVTIVGTLIGGGAIPLAAAAFFGAAYAAGSLFQAGSQLSAESNMEDQQRKRHMSGDGPDVPKKDTSDKIAHAASVVVRKLNPFA